MVSLANVRHRKCAAYAVIHTRTNCSDWACNASTLPEKIVYPVHATAHAWEHLQFLILACDGLDRCQPQLSMCRLVSAGC